MATALPAISLLGQHRLSARGIHQCVAQTSCGKVQGLVNQGVELYRGIPYGGPTHGERRFLPPSKPLKWTGTFDATRNGPRCPQGPGNIFLNSTLGEYFGGGRADRVALAQQTDSEDCLALNVLTASRRGKKPVMVYIHGGGFTGGSGLLGVFSDRFVREEDVVLVSLNHRLSVFGYLYLGDLDQRYADSGNAGQLDLVAALEWVRDNAAHFGGDPKNVTIFGESGGGAKISALMAMPAASGLFHKAIVESGSALRVSTPDQASQRARTWLDRAGIDAKQLDELQRLPVDKLLGSGGAWEPVADGRSIPQQTWSPAASALARDISMIIGNCKDERSLGFMHDDALFRMGDSELLDRVVKEGVPRVEAEKLLALYRRDHPHDSPVELFFRLTTDRGTGRNARIQVERKIAQAGAKVYMYYFAWNTPLAEGRLKAFHTAELPLAMRLTRFPETDHLSRQIAGAWAAFARTGSPAHSLLPEWPAYTQVNRATMIFDVPTSAVAEDPNRDERLIIDEIAKEKEKTS
jgi:para-nitrobenzyl esterase